MQGTRFKVQGTRQCMVQGVMYKAVQDGHWWAMGVRYPHKNSKKYFFQDVTKIVSVLILGTTENLEFRLFFKNDPPHCGGSFLKSGVHSPHCISIFGQNCQK